MSKDSQVCLHPNVYRKYEVDGKTWSDKWACGTCNAQFYHLENLRSGPITVMEPYVTLRDQFAVAALTAIITQGTMNAEMDVMPYVQDAYTIADAMLAARKESQ